MVTATNYEQVVLEDGVPHIRGTTMKVVELVAEHVHWHMDAAALQRGHPHLTMPQVHSALAYYYENRQSIDDDMARRDRDVDAIVAAQGETRLHRKMAVVKAAAAAFEAEEAGRMFVGGAPPRNGRSAEASAAGRP